MVLKRIAMFLLLFAILLQTGHGVLITDTCTCPGPGWMLHVESGNCLRKLDGTGYDWNGFVRSCQDQGDGSHAVSIHSASENEAVHEIGGRREIWIGADCQNNGRTFRWADGTDFVYTKWAPGEPNNSWGNEECVMMADNMHGNRDNWNDKGCWDRHTGVCKKAPKSGCPAN